MNQVAGSALAVVLYIMSDPGFQGAIGVWLGSRSRSFMKRVDQSEKPKAFVHASLGLYAIGGTVLAAYANGRLAELDLGTIAHAVAVWIVAVLAADSKHFLGDLDNVGTAILSTTDATVGTDGIADRGGGS